MLKTPYLKASDVACNRCSTVYLINDNLDKRTWTYVFGAGCMLSVLIPSMHNFRIWSFTGLLMTTYTAWYMTIAPAVDGQVTMFHYYLTIISRL